MKFRARSIAAIAIVVAVVAACGSTESDSTADRDRNVDVAVPNAKFGPNDNGIVVTPVKVTRSQIITTQSYKRQAAEPAVYGAITLRTYGEDNQANPTVDLKIVRIIAGREKLMFDTSYGVKTLAGAETLSDSTEVIVTQNRTVLLVDRQDDGQGGEVAVIRRYMLSTGKLDTTFGSKGQLTINPTRAGVSGVIRFVVEGIDGSLFVGVWEVSATPPKTHIIKYKGDGLRDESFGTLGVATLPPFGPQGETELFVNSAHVVWENSDRGSIMLAATMPTGFPGYDTLIPIRVTAAGGFNEKEMSDAYESRFWRIVAGHDVRVSVDAVRPDTLKTNDSGNAPEELVTRILAGGQMPSPPSGYLIYKSWVALNGFPGNRVATVTPYRFDDADDMFATDERILGAMTQFSIDGWMANIGTVTSRRANFQGLALMSIAPLNEERPGTLASTIRLADYPSTRLTPTRLRVGSAGQLYFSQRAFSSSPPLGSVSGGIVQKSWGVALDANGMQQSGMTTPVVESPINVAVATSRTANVENETESVTTVFDETGLLHALYPTGETLSVESVKAGGSLTRKGTPLSMSPTWGSPALPRNSDLVVVRDGVLWVAGVYPSLRAETLDVSAFGIAKFDLATGAIDASYGDDGVSVLGISALGDYGSRPPEIVVNPDGSSALVITTKLESKSQAFVLTNPSAGNKKVDLKALSQSMKPTIITIDNDVLTRNTIVNGPIGFGVDAAGRVVAAQVRRELAFKTSATRPDASFTVRIWRFGSNTQLDQSFDGGYVEHDITGSVDVQPYMDTVPQVAVQADGKILIGLNGVRSPDTLVIEAATARVREDVHVLARFTAAGQFDAITAPPPKPVVAPARIEALPAVPTQTEERAAVDNPFTGGTTLTESVVTIPEVKLPAEITAAASGPGASAASQSIIPPRIQILTAVSTLDRSIGVKWAIPASLAKAEVTYEVTASPGGKTCATTSTLCVFRGLDPWTPYSFTVAVKSGAEGVAASDPSLPAKPLRILARNKSVKTANLITPASKGKLKWKVTGACKLSKDAATLTLPKDATTCTLSVRSPKSGKTPATTRSITIDVRAIVN